jgi:hypothetical protein
LLGVSPRSLDFGVDDLVIFGEPVSNASPLRRIAEVRDSIWPEGEIRRLFPKTAGIWLHLIEVSRTIASAYRAVR